VIKHLGLLRFDRLGWGGACFGMDEAVHVYTVPDEFLTTTTRGRKTNESWENQDARIVVGLPFILPQTCQGQLAALIEFDLYNARRMLWIEPIVEVDKVLLEPR